MASPPDAATRHYLEQKAVTASVAQQASDLWNDVDVDNLDESWRTVGPKVQQITTAGQTIAASRADRYLDAVLDELGVDPSRTGSINPAAFAGAASDGRNLGTLLQSPIVATKTAIGQQVDRVDALQRGRASVMRIAATQVQDAGRAAVGAAMAGRPAVTAYSRMLVPPSCSRCAILAGRVYRWNAGFNRHPHCDCTQIPSSEAIVGDLTTDPRGYFDSLSPADQDRYFTQAGAEAIRNGADMGQVVNSRRGMYQATGDVRATRESTTVRGRNPGFRLMPEQIIADASSREEAIAGLQRYGYLSRSSAPKLDLNQPTAKATGAAARTRATISDPDVLAEARRRNVSPERVIELRSERAERRAVERATRRDAERTLSADNPEVIRVARANGVTPDEVLSARLRVADVRAVAREEAAKVQADAMRELDRLGTIKLKNPPRKGAVTEQGTAARRGEWDWLEQLSTREKNRLSRQWFGGESAPDQLAHAMSGALNREIDVDDAVQTWLDLNRRAESSGALRRGKLPSLDAYSGAIDPQDLIGSLADEGFDAVRLFGDDLDAAGHVAGVERQLAQDDALGYLGDAARAVEGPAPYRMGFQSWEEEVRTIEFHNAEGSATAAESRRYAELVPRLIDEPGLDYEDLYSRIVATAHKAGEEVPSYARIPWQ